ncbi:MAG TPA: biotin--[acetyl-CoA-carboxylase] ligase [Chthoniobacteraceae bacterium]|jgi:BirA family biotin operon repressor/biotin-[acetyl-CoA-carboxylase] ligase|nr:biotin--[acetyl-CoA-carboxylase] ligase [Chthoniobacteraceae bacterium]
MTPDTAILRRLREAEYVPAAELGPDAANSVEGLIAAGYGIEHHPYRGYRLVSAPDRLIADDILSRLPERRWIRDVLVFEKTGSTNDVINGLARDGAAAGIVAFAEEQTAGRGRLGRRWQSNPRLGLWFSLLLRPEMPLAEWPRLTLWIAYAVARGIRACTGLETMVKWPNDIYASGRKLAGILVESSPAEYATAGIGLNVNHPAFPPPLDATATSIRIETGAAVNRNALAAAILGALDGTHGLVSGGFNEVIAWAEEADCLRGRWVAAVTGSATIEGRAEGLDPADGALLIRNAAGEVARVVSGEVTRFSVSKEGK